jgi:hypothetical protein
MDPFEPYKFSDRLGNTQAIFGCSTVGVFRFNQLLGQIRHTLLNSAEDDLTWQFYYLSDRNFQAAVTECLALNNIDPDTVTLAMTNALLFDPGHLIAINTPPETATSRLRSEGATAEPATLGEVIGAIASHTESLEEAIRLAETVPAQQLQAIMGGKNKLQKLQTEEGKKQESAKSNRAKAKEQLEQLRQRAVG